MKREHSKTYIYGKHALIEALQNTPQVIRKVFISHELNDRELRFLLSKHRITAMPMKNKEASRMVGSETAHQGVIAIADLGALLTDFSDFAAALEPTPDTLLVLLDELTDPHNVGAIIRSAAGFGAAGVLLPTHNQASLTGAVVKTSAGMVFRVPLVSIGNANYALDTLKQKGFQSYALEMNGSQDVDKETFAQPTVFVIGNEAKGIRQKTLERCDTILRIPINSRCESLNASVSAAVVLYAWSAHHPSSLLISADKNPPSPKAPEGRRADSRGYSSPIRGGKEGS